MPDEKLTQFDYLLNAFECAAQNHEPYLEGYHAKRVALFAYVRDLEARSRSASAPAAEPAWQPAMGERVKIVSTGEIGTVTAIAPAHYSVHISKGWGGGFSAGQLAPAPSAGGTQGGEG